MLIRSLALFAAAAFCASAADDSSWSAAYPPHKIAGNLYYVGTADLACFLIATPEGHILVNTGLKDSTPLIRAGMEKLGFQLKDVKILLNMQAHYDHVAAMAEIQRLTGAKVYATEADAPILTSGGASDPHIGVRYPFAPVAVDRRLKDGDVIRLGGTELKTILMPGHTPGSVGYSLTLTESGRQIPALLANMESVVMPLVGNKFMPDIMQAYERTFRVQKALKPQIWVAAHASQYDMQRKHKTGSFVDPDGYQQAIQKYERAFQEQLARERQTR